MAAACSLSFGQGQCNGPNLGSAKIALTASGSTTVVVGKAGQNIHVCFVDLSLATAVGVKFVSIGAGGTDLSGVYANVVTGGWNRYGQATGLGLGWGINLSGASTGGGTVFFYLTNGY